MEDDTTTDDTTPADPGTEHEPAAAEANPTDATPEEDAADLAVFNEIMAREEADTATDDEVQPEEPEASKGGDTSGDTKTESEGGDAQPDFDSMIADNPRVEGYRKELGLDEASSEDLFDKALSALQRDGIYDEGELEARYKADAGKFIEQGLKRAKVQLGQDRLGDEVQRLKKERASGTEAALDPAYDGGESEKMGEAQATPEAVQEILERIKANEYHSDIAEDLEALVKAIGQPSADTEVVSGLRAELDKVNARLAEQHYQTIETKIDSARQKLAEEYPSITNDVDFERVLDHYDTLAGSGKYHTVEAAMAEAAKWALSETSASALKQRLINSTKKRKAGQPRASTTGPESKLSPDEQEEQTFREIERKHFGEHAA